METGPDHHAFQVVEMAEVCPECRLQPGSVAKKVLRELWFIVTLN